jgi:hypothetical protein
MSLGSAAPGSLSDPRQRHTLTLRSFYLPLALLVSFALVAQLFVTIHRHDLTTSTRILRMLSFFTIQSNALVCATSWGLVLRPQRAGMLWRVLRIDAIAGIAVTGIVYSIALSGLQELHGWARLCDNIFHYVVPILTVVGWLVIGPRGRVDRPAVLAGLIWPVLWFIYTLIHGAISGWYPYHFIDVGKIGYPQALLNALVVTMLLGLVLCLIWLVDQRANSLTGRGVRQRVRRSTPRRQPSS